jgi:hypothetical protein
LEISQKQNDLQQTPKPVQVEEMIECYQKLVASNSQAMLEERVMNKRSLHLERRGPRIFIRIRNFIFYILYLIFRI